VAETMSKTVGVLVYDLAAYLGNTREARDLVAALLDRPRSWPTICAGELAPPELVERAGIAARKLHGGAPMAYAVGLAAFRHMTLHVDERVLIPRPETEVLVDLVLNAQPGGTIVDLGTGSGAIALALATEGAYDRVIATDVSADALAVAAVNAQVVGARVEWRLGSWLAPLRGERVQAVVSNPPYISYDEAVQLEPGVRNWEPPVALLSANGGMAAIREIVGEAPKVLDVGGLLALEVDARRASLVAELVMSNGRYVECQVRLDLAGRERFVLARYIGSHDDS